MDAWATLRLSVSVRIALSSGLTLELRLQRESGLPYYPNDLPPICQILGLRTSQSHFGQCITLLNHSLGI